MDAQEMDELNWWCRSGNYVRAEREMIATANEEDMIQCEDCGDWFYPDTAEDVFCDRHKKMANEDDYRVDR
jgi:hypothetical protein